MFKIQYINDGFYGSVIINETDIQKAIQLFSANYTGDIDTVTRLENTEIIN